MHGLVAAKPFTFTALANYFTTKTKVDTSVNIPFQIRYLSLSFKRKSEVILKSFTFNIPSNIFSMALNYSVQ